MMFIRSYVAAALVAALTLSPAPAIAIDGEILITHAAALAGNVTPGDTAGYPVTISIPGSFKLASNLLVTSIFATGIHVTSTFVTIDLNGFTLAAGRDAFYGITSNQYNGTIRNGFITRFQYDGIRIENSGWTVEDVVVTANRANGIVVTGNHSRVINSNVSANLGSGIIAGQTALIQSNIVAGNHGIGVVTGNSSLIQGNTVSLNSNIGIYTSLSTVVGNTINSNGSWGLYGNGATGYSGNTLFANNGAGTGGNATGVVRANPNACVACP
jgi:hypothetical protein